MTIWMGPLEIMRRTSSRSGSSFQSFETSGGAFARRWSPPAIIGTASSEKTPLGPELASAQPIGAEADRKRGAEGKHVDVSDNMSGRVHNTKQQNHKKT